MKKNNPDFGADLFTDIFENATLGIVVVDTGGTIRRVNPYAEELFGYPAGELNEQKLNILIPPASKPVHRRLREGYMAHPVPRPMGIGRELTGLKKDGTTFYLEISLSAATVNGERFSIAFVSNVDARVAAVKRAETAVSEKEEFLRNYAESLRKEVEIRTAELKESEEKLKYLLGKERELGELKSRFVSMASHEFRTPLSTVLSSTELLEMYAEKGKYDKMSKHIGTIKKSVANLNNILNDFLSLEKLETGTVELNLQQADLQLLSEEVKEEVALMLKPGQKIKTRFTGNSVALLDTFLVRNILLNLLSNAVKYSPENKEIFWTTDNGEGGLTITVKDEGIGIPPEDQKNMFTRFYRASNVSNIKGTGLGLTIIKRHLDLMQGSISFVSEKGKGTTFTVKIPASSR